MCLCPDVQSISEVRRCQCGSCFENDWVHYNGSVDFRLTKTIFNGCKIIEVIAKALLTILIDHTTYNLRF